MQLLLYRINYVMYQNHSPSTCHSSQSTQNKTIKKTTFRYVLEDFNSLQDYQLESSLNQSENMLNEFFTNQPVALQYHQPFLSSNRYKSNKSSKANDQRVVWRKFGSNETQNDRSNLAQKQENAIFQLTRGFAISPQYKQDYSKSYIKTENLYQNAIKYFENTKKPGKNYKMSSTSHQKKCKKSQNKNNQAKIQQNKQLRSKKLYRKQIASRFQGLPASQRKNQQDIYRKLMQQEFERINQILGTKQKKQQQQRPYIYYSPKVSKESKKTQKAEKIREKQKQNENQYQNCIQNKSDSRASSQKTSLQTDSLNKKLKTECKIQQNT